VVPEKGKNLPRPRHERSVSPATMRGDDDLVTSSLRRIQNLRGILKMMSARTVQGMIDEDKFRHPRRP